MLRADAAIDVRSVLPRVATPTLVMHRRGDRVVPVRGGRAFAALVPGARWLELEGDDHLPFTGDVASVIDPIHEFLAGLQSSS